MDYRGLCIDQYQIIEKLGQGGMAVVYKAYDTRLERDVAIKVVRKESIPPEHLERILKRFEREAKALAKFLHPNIVPVHNYGEYQNAPYLVMSFLPGGTLKERIGEPVPTGTALGWVLPIAKALRYAHKRGVIHRDVKPSNILTTEDGALMLSDFGIAQLLEQATTQLTVTGMGVGTPEYMAPEQWQGQAIEASDQYALGVVLYELLTGQKPFTAETPLAVALKVLSDPLPIPSTIVGNIPEGVEKLLYKALARNPQDRFEDMDAFRASLEGQLLDQPVQAQDADLTHIPDPTPVAAERLPKPRSEAETVDDLAQTPVEKLPVRVETLQEQPHKRSNPGQSSQSPVKGKSGLPGWTLWAGGAVFIVALLVGGVSLLTGVNRNTVPVDEPTGAAIGQVDTPILADTEKSDSIATETPLPTATVNKTSTATRTPTITPTQEPKLGIGSTRVNPVDDAVLVYVPEGEFLMGSDDDDASNYEKPQRLVYLDAFWIYQNPVTNKQYRTCVEANSCRVPDVSEYFYDTMYDDHPVIYTGGYDATTYCSWIGGRLPKPAEWEKAARGTDGRLYPWGDQNPNCSLANYFDCVGGTTPVGSYPEGASPYGALDMAGNVWEWIEDWHTFSYRTYNGGLLPRVERTERVARGGSWRSGELYLLVTKRTTNPNQGFRCLLSEAP